MADAKTAAKKKFGDLFGGADEPDGDEPEDGEEEGAGEGEEDDAGYDLKACANDIMAAVKAGDVDALEEALGELLQKGK